MNTAQTSILRTEASAQVLTVPPIALAEGCTVLFWKRRSTKETPVAQENMYRGMVIEYDKIKVPDDACKSTFSRLLQATISSLAQEMFTAWAAENITAPIYTGAAINVNSVLSFYAEQKQREVIDAKQIAEWLPKSATWGTLSEKQKAVWLKLMPKIAAPAYRNVGISPTSAGTAILRFADEDAEHPVCCFLLQRLTNIAAVTTDLSEGM